MLKGNKNEKLGTCKVCGFQGLVVNSKCIVCREKQWLEATRKPRI